MNLRLGPEEQSKEHVELILSIFKNGMPVIEYLYRTGLFIVR